MNFLQLLRDVFSSPQDGVIRCGVCGFNVPCSVEERVQYRKTGWPLHCGLAMVFSSEGVKTRTE